MGMQAVSRAASVLRALAEADRDLGVAEVAAAVGLPIGSVHRMLMALAEEQLVSRSPTSGRFRISSGLYRIAVRGFERRGLAMAAAQPLARLRDRTGETAFVCQLVGQDVVCVAIAETLRPLRLFVQVGQTMPPHAAASARVVLAYRDQAEVERILQSHQLDAFTATTPSTREDVLTHLTKVRASGYDICDDELDEHVWAVAAPVRVDEELVAASVTVAAPSRRLPDAAARAEVVDAVRVTAAEIEETTRAWHERSVAS
jgi:IclR family acetate operon transcriptional repressor